MLLKNSIYLTGIHRSGTSWIGKMLSFGGEFILKDEEIFNLARNMHLTQNSPVNYWYLQIYEQNEHKYIEYIERILANRYSLIKALSYSQSITSIGKSLFFKNQSLKRQLFESKYPRIIIEPLGLLSTNWFYDKFDPSIIVVIRHPASFISSLKRLNWKFDFSNLIDQEHLMAGSLQKYQEEIKNSKALADDIIGQGILLWRLLYSVVKEYQEQYPDWIYMRHEDLAADPIGSFRGLYKRLGLNFTPVSKAQILKYSGDLNPPEPIDNKEKAIRRRSRDMVRIWSKRLEHREIERIKEGVWSVACNWYSEVDW